MAPDPIDVQALSQQYHESDDEGQEQLFQDLYTSHYKGPRTAPDDLANTLKPLLLSLDILPRTSDTETMYVVVGQELCFGMQRFCLSTPPGTDHAWNPTTRLISQLGQIPLEPGQFDPHAFFVAELKYWIAEFPSDDHCNMDNITSIPVRKDDASIISVPRTQWDNDSTEQLANLARNREARKGCVIHKVIAARALGDGYAPRGPQNTAFPGACELRFIESALQCRQNGTIPGGGVCLNSADAIAATFQLRACAKSLLASLPSEGCELHELWEMAPVGAGEEGRSVRLGMWKEALERIVVGEQQGGRCDFALMGYAVLALMNLRDPRDETSEELFSWANIVF